MAHFWINQHVFIAEIAVTEASCMHPSDGSCQQQTDFEIGKRIASFTRIEEFILVAGAGKPFAFFLPAFNIQKIIVFGTIFKEKMVLVGWNHDTDFIPMLNNVGRPTKQILPVFATGLSKNVLPVAAGDHINTIPGLLILRFLIKSDDVRFIRRKVNILHRA